MLPRILTLLLTLTVLTGISRADCEWPDEKDPVKITLVVVLASETDTKVDKKLKDLAPEVQKLHPHLKGFRVKSEEAISVKPNEKVSLLCVENKYAELLVKHGADKDNKISLRVKPPMMSELEYQTVCGKFLPIVTPCKTDKKQTVILAIRVEPCNKGK
jgi:hypothetical protein